MEWLKNFIDTFFTWLWKGFTWILDGLVEIIGTVFFWIYDGFLLVVYSFVAAIDVSAMMFNMAAEYSSMPDQLIWMINQVNLPQALSYVGLALVIRMSLNLIPASFTRI